jgi:UDP-N-acetylmuramoylalanine--D-glutamate ligase
MKLILGLGKTGLSCVRYLARQNIPMIVMDTRSNPPGLSTLQTEFPNIPVYLGEFDVTLVQQVDEIIASPGLEIPAAIMALNIPIVGDIELFARAANAPVVAITGTNAKGTVTTLVSDMIRQAGLTVGVGGNIGTPALELLAEPVPDFYVLEISSFQLETTYSLKLQAATILNISEDHLDRHKTMAAYIAAKQKIYQHCSIAVWNREDENTSPLFISQKYKLPSPPVGQIRQERISRRAAPEGGEPGMVLIKGGRRSDEGYVSFGFSEPKTNEFGLRQIDEKIYLAYGQENLLAIDELLIKGKHNWLNALAALALGNAIHLPILAMLQALRSFKGLTHRCEWVAEQDGVTWYNDSKGTNVGATLAAIEGLGESIKGKLVLIAGGIGKGADFSQLQAGVARYVKTIILIGKDAPLIAAALQDIKTLTIEYSETLQHAVQGAKAYAKQHDIVVLSPACASLDMFRDFEERGEIFKTLVRGLLV